MYLIENNQHVLICFTEGDAGLYPQCNSVGLVLQGPQAPGVLIRVSPAVPLAFSHSQKGKKPVLIVLF